MQAHDNADLKRVYSQRFSGVTAYRSKVWQTLIGCYFSKFIPENSSVLDLGCGYGEFINNVRAGNKYGMDLNARLRRAFAF